MSKYVNLRRANMAANFLDTNSTTHEFLFGALAELVDNARDAEAKNLYIYSIHNTDLRGNYILCFRDDGCGMTPDESSDVIVFGKSSKKSSDINLIGQHGNGLKSGAYRIGKEILIFTKKRGVGTIIYISGEFLAQEKLKEIVVPMPSFDMNSMRCYQPPDEDDATSRHNLELEVITKYSPFKTRDELIKHFDLIDGQSGTLVMVYKLVLVDGQSELDFETDPFDIQTRDAVVSYDRKERSYPAHKSFREYVSILYDDPRMSIYIQDKRVTTKILEKSLYMPAVFTFAGKMFKANAVKSRDEAEEELRVAKTSLTEAKSVYQHADRKYQSRRDRDNKESIKELTEAKRRMEEAQRDVSDKTRQVENRKRDINSFQSLKFTFGINIHNRDYDGLFIYNGHRLLIMHESSKHQLGSDREDYRGIVGVVNVPYFCAKPTANKQAFANQAEQRNLLNVMADCMIQYANQLNFSLSDKAFWSKFGYPGRDMRGGPVPESEGGDKNAFKTRIQYSRPVLQCCKCLKWRVIRPTPRSWTSEYYKDNWTCADNTDMENGDCSKPEDLSPPTGTKIPVLEYQKPKDSNIRELESGVELIARDTSSFQRLEPRAAKTNATNKLIVEVIESDDEEPPKSTKRRSESSTNTALKRTKVGGPSDARGSASNTVRRQKRRIDDDMDDEDDENNYLQDILENTIEVDPGHTIVSNKTEPRETQAHEKQIRELSAQVDELKSRITGLLMIMARAEPSRASEERLANMRTEELLRIDLMDFMKSYNKNILNLGMSTLRQILNDRQRGDIKKEVRQEWEAQMKSSLEKFFLADLRHKD